MGQTSASGKVHTTVDQTHDRVLGQVLASLTSFVSSVQTQQLCEPAFELCLLC